MDSFAERMKKLRKEGGKKWLLIYNNELDEQLREHAEQDGMEVCCSVCGYVAVEGGVTAL